MLKIMVPGTVIPAVAIALLRGRGEKSTHNKTRAKNLILKKTDGPSESHFHARWDYETPGTFSRK